uniref:Uncharacterized protein n=1 Tax=Kalanchoe fedtschenkoi TaxID=63787 RepID=A0A7N0URD3_KALFE
MGRGLGRLVSTGRHFTTEKLLRHEEEALKGKETKQAHDFFCSIVLDSSHRVIKYEKCIMIFMEMGNQDWDFAIKYNL